MKKKKRTRRSGGSWVAECAALGAKGPQARERLCKEGGWSGWRCGWLKRVAAGGRGPWVEGEAHLVYNFISLAPREPPRYDVRRRVAQDRRHAHLCLPLCDLLYLLPLAPSRPSPVLYTLLQQSSATSRLCVRMSLCSSTFHSYRYSQAWRRGGRPRPQSREK